MEMKLTLLILAVNVAILSLNIFFAFRLRLISYLLEQPVVKKMTPNTKLKPFKIEKGPYAPDQSKPGQMRPSNRDSRDGRDGREGRENREGREGRDGRDGREGRENRDGRDGRENRDGRESRDSWDKNQRNGKNRMNRGNRRMPRPDKIRSETVMGNPASEAPMPNGVDEAEKPIIDRPVAAMSEQPVQEPAIQETAVREPVREPVRESSFGRSEPQPAHTAVREEAVSEEPIHFEDVHHGRRPQLKKPPVFEEDQK